MLRHLPLLITALAIVGLTVVNGVTTSRWTGANVKAELCAEYLRAVPLEIGDWVGEPDSEVSDDILRVAGAEGVPVSRLYRHSSTGKEVSVWIIVGHSNLIVRHTPDICYPANGFRPTEKYAHHEIPVENGVDASSWTGLFHKQGGPGLNLYRRVFWMWYQPRPGSPVTWEAPGHEIGDARDKFAGSKALFKLYLMTNASSESEGPDESVAMEFADEFFPVLEQLFAGTADGKPAPPPVEGSEPAAAESEAAETAEADA